MKGQAFVVFQDINHACVAHRAMQGFVFFNKPMRVQFAKTKSDAVAKLEPNFVPRERSSKPDSECSFFIFSLYDVFILSFWFFFCKNILKPFWIIISFNNIFHNNIILTQNHIKLDWFVKNRFSIFLKDIRKDINNFFNLSKKLL